MKKIVIAVMLLFGMANAGRLDLVDELISQGAEEVFKKEWKQSLIKIDKVINRKNLSERQKTEVKDKIANMGNDPIFIRETIKANVESATKDMSKEEIEDFTKMFKNKNIKKITKMVDDKKLLWEKGKNEKEEEENFYRAVKKELNKEEFEEYRAIMENKLYIDTLIRFYITNQKLDENKQEVIDDAIRGGKIIIEMRDE